MHWLASRWNADVAVDLGTSTFRVATLATHQVVTSPAARDGRQALRGGVVVDVAFATELLQPLLRRARSFGLLRPRAIVGVPTDASPAERDAAVNAVRGAGAAAVALFSEPLAAAVGARLDVASPYAQMVIDVGHGVTDAAVLREGTVVASRAVRTGCGDLEQAVRARVLGDTGVRLPVGAERELLQALRFDQSPAGVGAWRVEAVRSAFEVDLGSIAEVVAPLRDRILAAPAELVRAIDDRTGAEIVEAPVFVTGGGALLPGMVAAIARAIGLEACPVAEPLLAVVEGNRTVLRTLQRFDGWT